MHLGSNVGFLCRGRRGLARLIISGLVVSGLVASTLAASATKPLPAPPSGPIVYVSQGVLAGTMNGSVAVFEGIPFAAPPVGPLRWREPQPAAAWTGTRDASRASHPCMQNVHGTDNFVQPLAATYGARYSLQQLDPSEDCLYLNVWTPRLQAGAKLPVMLWLHGGSNRVGSGAEPGYEGTALTSHGVIVVTVNYRLGVMGFFAHPELAAESPHHSAGDYGLLDQLAALQWVKQNIAQFGGDPGNVTLFGESAGSVDAINLIASPLSTNLFRRVIAESGPGFGNGVTQTLAKMDKLGVAVGKAAGAPAGAQIDTLRKLPADQVDKLESELIATDFKGYDPNGSIVEGWVLPQSPAKAFATGAIQHVNLLAGMNAREFSAFRIDAADAARKAPKPAKKSGASDQIAQFANTARQLYGGWTDLAVGSYMVKILAHGNIALDQAANDIVGACPTGAEAALVSNSGQAAFVYRFDRTVPGKGQAELGAFHSLEIPYVFGTFQARTFNWLPFDATDQKLSQTVQAYWTNFAKTGDPNGSGLPHWSSWNSDSEPYLAFSQNGDAVPEKDFSPAYCHLSPDRLKTQIVDY